MWLQVWGITHSHLWRDSFISVVWLIQKWLIHTWLQVWGMAHSHLWRDWHIYICVVWLIHMSLIHIYNSYVATRLGHGSFSSATWLIHKCGIIDSYMQQQVWGQIKKKMYFMLSLLCILAFCIVTYTVLHGVATTSRRLKIIGLFRRI